LGSGLIPIAAFFSCVFAELVCTAGILPQRILDIGAGTGVVTLMLAHHFQNASATAVEPDSSVADVAHKNFDQNIWLHRITLQRARIQDFVGTQEEKFDLVVCNPPYFQNSMPSFNRATEIARHNSDLSPSEIYEGMLRNMTRSGSAWLSFPEESASLWLNSGKERGLHLTHHFILSEHPTAKPHIAVAGWSRTMPTDVINAKFFYRIAPQGALSPWMKDLRRKWFPAKFNKNMYSVDL
jgi:tRNA1Val (adenine37-N6)-methyltransferase